MAVCARYMKTLGSRAGALPAVSCYQHPRPLVMNLRAKPEINRKALQKRIRKRAGGLHPISRSRAPFNSLWVSIPG